MIRLELFSNTSTTKPETAKKKTLAIDDTITKVAKTPLEQPKGTADISSSLSQKNVTIQNSDPFSPRHFLEEELLDFPSSEGFNSFPDLAKNGVDLRDYYSGIGDRSEDTQISETSTPFISQSTSFSKKRKLEDFDEGSSAFSPTQETEYQFYSSSSSSSSSIDSLFDITLPLPEDSASTLASSHSSGIELTVPTMEVTSSQEQSDCSSVYDLSGLPFHPFKPISTSSCLTASELVQCYKLWREKRLESNYIEVSDQIEARLPLNYPLLMIDILLLKSKGRTLVSLSKDFNFNNGTVKNYNSDVKKFPGKISECANKAIVEAAATLIKESDPDKKETEDPSISSSQNSLDKIRSKVQSKAIAPKVSPDQCLQSIKKGLADNPYKPILSLSNINSVDLVEAYLEWKKKDLIPPTPNTIPSETRKPKQFPLLMIDALIEMLYLEKKPKDIFEKFRFPIELSSIYKNGLLKLKEKRPKHANITILEAASSLMEKFYKVKK